MSKLSTIVSYDKIQSFDWVVLLAALIMLAVSISAAMTPAKAQAEVIGFTSPASISSISSFE